MTLLYPDSRYLRCPSVIPLINLDCADESITGSGEYLYAEISIYSGILTGSVNCAARKTGALLRGIGLPYLSYLQ